MQVIGLHFLLYLIKFLMNFSEIFICSKNFSFKDFFLIFFYHIWFPMPKIWTNQKNSNFVQNIDNPCFFFLTMYVYSCLSVVLMISPLIMDLTQVLQGLWGVVIVNCILIFQIVVSGTSSSDNVVKLRVKYCIEIL